jgi:GT2 family glycosyltransferase
MVASIDYPIEMLLVIDNGNADTEIIENPNIKEVRRLHMPTNQGVAGSWNLGIKLLPFEPVWFFSSADTEYKPGALAKLAEASPSAVTLCKEFPYWQTFAIGEQVVRQIGLFDENLYPIYFEDNDYMRRCIQAQIAIVYADVVVHHDNSSTINSDPNLHNQNRRTFADNENYFKQKYAGLWHWSLDRRRQNYWQL